jgi:hypothetical protein
MNTTDFLNKVAFISDSKIDDDDEKVYYSKFDDSYITRVGMEDDVEFLAELEVTEELTHGVGFSPKDNKWYGWSHRAIFGFGIGSTCVKGDCHYMAKDKDDFLEDTLRFWDDDCHVETTAVHDRHEVMHSESADPLEEGEISDGSELVSVPSGEFEDGVTVSWVYDDKVENVSIRGEIGSVFSSYPETWGRGEWTAETMADAKQMAVDFCEGVS